MLRDTCGRSGLQPKVRYIPSPQRSPAKSTDALRHVPFYKLSAECTNCSQAQSPAFVLRVDSISATVSCLRTVKQVERSSSPRTSLRLKKNTYVKPQRRQMSEHGSIANSSRLRSRSALKDVHSHRLVSWGRRRAIRHPVGTRAQIGRSLVDQQLPQRSMLLPRRQCILPHGGCRRCTAESHGFHQLRGTPAQC